jgi:Cu/Ag efflux pump CusA
MNSPFSGRRVFVVEDEMIVAWLLEDMLAALGCAVVGPAVSVNQSLAMLNESEILDAAVEGSRLRLRPILMTSFAFILGCVPLMLASGSGAASRSTMGTGVVFGMTIATAVGLFIIPVCYVFVQRIVEHRKKPEEVAAFPAGAIPEGGAH